MEAENSPKYVTSTESTLYNPTSDERTMAILCHVLAIFVSFWAPLIIYLIKKNESKYVTEHAKESLNFQITVALAIFASIILMFVLIGFFLIWAVPIASAVFAIIATIKASENKIYRYPVSIRFIK